MILSTRRKSLHVVLPRGRIEALVASTRVHWLYRVSTWSCHVAELKHPAVEGRLARGLARLHVVLPRGRIEAGRHCGGGVRHVLVSTWSCHVAELKLGRPSSARLSPRLPSLIADSLSGK